MFLKLCQLTKESRILFLLLSSISLLPLSVHAQTYTNVVNQRFAAVGNGPQSALIVDISNPNNRAASISAMDAKLHSLMLARDAALQSEISRLKSVGALRPGHSIPVVDTVLFRNNGRLILPRRNGVATRGAGNGLTFVISTTGQYAFDPATAAALSNTVNTLFYPALVNLMGSPLWNGQVTILNKDDNPTLVSGIIGVTVVVNTDGSIDIDLPNFNTPQDEYLGLLQAMAQTFYGPEVMGFDSFATGMARAEAVVVAQSLQGRFPNNASVDPISDFYYTANYDILNQPSLGNSTFFPPTKMAQPISGQFGGMLIPRLEMSSTAWTKCYVENPSFFSNFTTAYTAAWQQNNSVADNEPQLEQIASQAVGGSVEGQPFSQWFQQQYIFDASVIPGSKEYAFVTDAPASSTSQDGANVVLLYYNTTSSGDEQDLSGVCNPVFYDYTYLNSLTLPGADTAIQIPTGEGYSAPTFSNIGQNPVMRVSMDFPLSGMDTHLYYPANASTGSGFGVNTFYGVTVGSDTGTVNATFSGGNGQAVTAQVAQGAFGALGSSAIVPLGFTKVTLTYQPAAPGSSPITFQRNVFVRTPTNSAGLNYVEPMFILQVPGATTTLTHVFSAGPQLISLPLKPLNPDMAAVFGVAPSQALIAQWNQSIDSSSGLNYMLYPNLPLYQPGYGLWTNFQSALNGGAGQNGISITGVRTDNENLVTIGLQYGWNMIGDPFNANVDLTSNGSTGTSGGAVFQYQGGSALTFTQAVSAGYLGSGIFGFNSSSSVDAYVDITQTQAANSPFQQFQLQPWNGYFILCNEPEGLTMTIVNPSPNTRMVSLPFHVVAINSRSAPSTPLSGWRLNLNLQDSNGHEQTAVFGQASNGSTRYVPSLDSAVPPPITQNGNLSIYFSQPDWQTRMVGSNFLSDIRPRQANSTWNVLVNIPKPGGSYTLTWPNLADVPSGTTLTLTDLDTRASTELNTSSSYSFIAAPGETTRKFQITASRTAALAPLVIGLHTVIIPGAGGRAVAGASIQFDTSVPAQVNVDLRGLNGQVIRHLDTGRAVTAGTQNLIWDLKNDEGVQMPAGTYLVEVQIITSNGRQSRAITPCIITR